MSTIFDSDQTALLKNTDPSTRTEWLYMIETELLPRAVSFGKWKAVWNLREDCYGPAVYTAEAPRLYDLWLDPQGSYDRHRPERTSS